LPVRVLSRVFRGKYLALLRQAYSVGELTWHGDLAGLAAPAAFAAWLRAPYQRDWVGYAKEPLAGPEPVWKYLARYTHRVALSNRRLLSCHGETVRFMAKDDAAGGRPRVVTLSTEAFLRRWVQHVLPRGCVKIRPYGLLANRNRAERLALCRVLLAVLGLVLGLWAAGDAAAGGSARRWPACGSGPWAIVAALPRGAGAAVTGVAVAVPAPDRS
jgi:hypothetical protein